MGTTIETKSAGRSLWHRGAMLLAIAALLAGCASEKADPTDPSAGARSTNGRTGNDGTTGGGTSPTAPSGGGSGNPLDSLYSSGSTVTLNATASALRDFFAMRHYFAGTTVRNPTNITINVDMSTTYDPVIIGYDEVGGGGWERGLGTHHPQSNVQDASYNGWYTINGQTVWKGFFQDYYGAIVLIINGVGSGIGDGLPGSVSGKVYYQNFNLYYPNNPEQGPLKMCWQITAGNHDCRTYMVAGGIQMGSAIDPNPGDHGPNMSIGYQYLGSFSNLSRGKAGF